MAARFHFNNVFLPLMCGIIENCGFVRIVGCPDDDFFQL